uniref:Cadherin domain-containing protein n=1 Tax=Eptatretus burgeri TaxID=7764 RepID=A0A8C4N4R9_EPTBU
MTVQLIMTQRPNEISTFKGLASALTLLCLTLKIKDAEGFHESGRPRKIDGRIIHMSILEEVKLGTIVGSLSEGHPGQSRFKLLKPDNESLVALNELNGQVKIVRRVDREELCILYTQPCFIYFDVVVNEQPSQLLHIHLEVIDINDNPPTFLQPSIALKIPKDAALGTQLPLQRAQDQDTGANGLIRYFLEFPSNGGDVYPFSLNYDSSRDLPQLQVGSYRDPSTTSPSGASAFHPPLPLFLPLSSMGNGSSDVQLTQASPTGEVSQLLVLLRQGGCQPRPCFRGNKYARGTRPSVDLEHGSLKDSGRGESDGGDGDWGGGGRSGLERGWGSGWVAGRMEGGWMAGRPMGRGAASTSEECGLVEGALLLREAFLKDCQTAFKEVDCPQVSSPSSISVPPVPPTFSTFGKFRGGGSERGQFYTESMASPLQTASSSNYKPTPHFSSSQYVLSPLSSCFHQSPSSCSPLSSSTRGTLSPLPSSSFSLTCSPLLLSSTSSPLPPIPSCSPSVKCRPTIKIETEGNILSERCDGREIDDRMERGLKQNVEVEGQDDVKKEDQRETRDVRGRNIEPANKFEKRKKIDKISREAGGEKGSRKETDEGLGGFKGREEEGFDHVLSLLEESAQSGSLWLDPEEMVAEVTRLLLQR